MQTYAESIPPGYILAKDAQSGHRYGIALPRALGVPRAEMEYEIVTVESEPTPCDCPRRFFSDIVHVKVNGEEELRHLSGGQLLRVE